MNKEKNNLLNILEIGKKRLKNANIITWSLDAEILLSKVLKVNRIKLLTGNDDIIITVSEKIEYDKYISRRIKMEPVQYIVNKSEFMALDFYVNKDVLIPRVETEILVELAMKYINKNKMKNIIDMCTGSGCIAISLYYYCSCLKSILAVDISKRALDIAKMNYKKNKIYNDEKLKFIESDMFSNIPIEYKNKIDMLICNPPYIETLEICNLENNVKEYEPYIALDGGEDGLYYYRELAMKAKRYLSISGKILMEIDCKKAYNIKKIFLKEGYKDVCVKKDLSGLDRVVIASR